MVATKHRIDSVLPKNDPCTPGVLSHQPVHGTIGRLVSIREKLNEETEPTAGELHKTAAPVVRAMFDACGKYEAIAALLRKPKQVISDYAAGVRGMPVSEFFAVLAAYPEAWLELSRIYCEHHRLELPQPRAELTDDQVDDAAFEVASDGTLEPILVTRLMKRHGVSEQEARRAIKGRR